MPTGASGAPMASLFKQQYTRLVPADATSAAHRASRRCRSRRPIDRGGEVAAPVAPTRRCCPDAGGGKLPLARRVARPPPGAGWVSGVVAGHGSGPECSAAAQVLAAEYAGGDPYEAAFRTAGAVP